MLHFKSTQWFYFIVLCCTMGNGNLILPVLGLNPLSLLPKQAEGLGPGYPQTGCPMFLALQSFQQLHGLNQLEKLLKIV